MSTEGSIPPGVTDGGCSIHMACRSGARHGRRRQVMDQHEAVPAAPGDDGASSVEYALIVFAIAATMVVALFALGPPVYDLFDSSCQAVNGGVSGAAGPVACP